MKKKENIELQPISTGKIQYGRIQSKKAIANVLSVVLSSYKYTSFPELNAVLQQYNVFADRGSENSRIFKSKGLVYRILDENGKPIGVPIKASDFYNKPSLPFLEEKFISNAAGQTSDKNRVKNVIDLAFLSKKPSLVELVQLLEKEGINTVLRKSEEGILYGITYVDHTTKCVFNGSSLGKQYSAKAIQERCGLITVSEQKMSDSTIKKSTESKSKIPNQISPKTSLNETFQREKSIVTNTTIGKVLDMLTQSEQAANYVPNLLKGKRKKKKRKGQSDNQ